MNNVRKNVLIALAALTLGGAAFAAEEQAPPPQGPHQHQQMSPEQRQAKRAEFQAKMAEHRAQRQQQLHDALKLSGAQEQAWNTFVASMKPAERQPHPDRAAFANLSAPERMQKMIEFSKQRTARMESRQAALNTFYSPLNPEQKKVFDEQTRRGMGEHHGMHGQHRPGMMRG